MSRQPDDMSLGTGLIRKGEARGLSPATAVPSAREEMTPSLAPAAAISIPASTSQAREREADEDPPLRAPPPDDIPKRFTSFRLPVSLDEDLRAMMFETRRSKQDLLIEFVTEGVKNWRRERVKRQLGQ